jgi:predicted nucleic acid-binding protein
VHPATLAIAGRIEEQPGAIRVPFAVEDLLIGTAALDLGYEVATLNIRDSRRIPGLAAIQL